MAQSVKEAQALAYFNLGYNCAQSVFAAFHTEMGLDEAQALLNTFWDLGHDILLQQFVAESRGRDVRALVVGDRVVAAMRRQAKDGAVRSHIHRGAEGKACL